MPQIVDPKWSKVTKLSKSIAIALFIVLPLAAFYLGQQYGNLLQQANRFPSEEAASQATTTAQDITSEVVNTPVINIPAGARKTASEKTSSEVNQNYSYGAAVNLFQNRRIQFIENCQAIPTSIALKNNTALMFDNRINKQISFTLDGKKYALVAYGFKIIALSSSRLPHTVQVNCGSGVNSAQVILQ